MPIKDWKIAPVGKNATTSRPKKRGGSEDKLTFKAQGPWLEDMDRFKEQEKSVPSTSTEVWSSSPTVAKPLGNAQGGKVTS